MSNSYRVPGGLKTLNRHVLHLNDSIIYEVPVFFVSFYFEARNVFFVTLDFDNKP